MKRGDAQLHSLAGAYSLDALGFEERNLFEAHLGGCEPCAQETREFLDTAARLGAAAGLEPPVEMKRHVLATAATTRQLSPLAHPARPGYLRIRRRQGVAQPPAAAGARQPGAGVRGWRPTRRLTTVALGAAVVAVGLIAAIATVAADRHPPRSDPRIASVLTAPDAITLTTTVTGGGTSTIVMSPHQGRLVFAASGLALLPKSECYMLWLIRPNGDIPASRLPAPDDGMTGPVVAGGIAEHDHLGLTIQPTNATEHPTTAMLIDLTL